MNFRADFRARKSTRDKEKRYEMIKEPDFQDIQPSMRIFLITE